MNSKPCTSQSERKKERHLEIKVHPYITEFRQSCMLVLCQIQEDGFKCTFSDDQPISDISESELVCAIETLPLPVSKSTESPYLQLIVVHTIRESD